MTEGFPIAFGRYELTERLAVGGMAELFLARVTGAHGFEKTIVIKRILPHLARDEQFTDMFISEAKITAELSHPKIAQTYELGQCDNQLYIAMEFVDGLDVLAMLRESAHRRRRIPAHLSVHVVREVLDALAFAHQQKRGGGVTGVVHRDISPSNILVSRTGDVKLVDFGIAHAIATDPDAAAGTLKGKYGYMSPEQIVGDGLNSQSDLFSVGVVLAEMLLGRRLFAAPNELDVLLMVRDVDLSRLERLGQHIEPGLVHIVRTALQKELSARYATALDFREALDEWMFENNHRTSSNHLAGYVEELYDDAARRRREQIAKAAVGEAGEVPGAVEPELAGDGAPRSVGTTPPGPEDATGNVPVQPKPVPVHLSGDVVPMDIAFSLTGSEERRRVASEVPTGEGTGQGAAAEDFELSIRYPSISAAVASLSPPGADPASKDFDDSSVADEAAPVAERIRKQRLPTAQELAQAPRPAPPQLDDIVATPTESGMLIRTPPLKLLFDLAVRKSTGLLVLSVGDIRKELYIRDGVPEYVSSNVAGELFGAYLVSQGAITDGELDMALAMMPHYGGKLGDTLVGLGLMKPLDVFRLLTRQVREKVIDVCSWETGSYLWYAGRRSKREAFPLDIDPFEVLGVGASELSTSYVEDWLAEVGTRVARSVRSPQVEPEAFRLGRGLRDLYNELDGRRMVIQVIESSKSTEARLRRLRYMFLLVQSGLARFMTPDER